jgi:hypothetical protein
VTEPNTVKGSLTPNRRAAGGRCARPERGSGTSYRAARWPHLILAVLCVIAMIGGAWWQAPVLFGSIALLILTVQLCRFDFERRQGQARALAEADEIDAAWRDSALSPEEAERVIRGWRPPAGWR